MDTVKRRLVDINLIEHQKMQFSFLKRTKNYLILQTMFFCFCFFFFFFRKINGGNDDFRLSRFVCAARFARNCTPRIHYCFSSKSYVMTRWRWNKTVMHTNTEWVSMVKQFQIKFYIKTQWLPRKFRLPWPSKIHRDSAVLFRLYHADVTEAVPLSLRYYYYYYMQVRPIDK